MTPSGPYRPASWRGIEFGIWDTEGSFGRATALHEYPFRDAVWVEDLGRGTRRLGLIGFGVGDDVAAIEREMIEAAEEEGPGQLVHPTLGLLKASLVEFRSRIRHDLHRVVEFHFLFIEDGANPLTLLGFDLAGKIALLADGLDLAAGGDFASKAGGALQAGAAAARQVQQTVGGWTRVAMRLTGDVRAVLNVAALVAPGIDRRFGRFEAGYRSRLAPVSASLRTTTGGLDGLARAQRTVTGLVAQVTSRAGAL